MVDAAMHASIEPDSKLTMSQSLKALKNRSGYAMSQFLKSVGASLGFISSQSVKSVGPGPDLQFARLTALNLQKR